MTFCSLSLSLSQLGHRVAVLGASGGIGQPMALLLKQSTSVCQLALYDIVGTPGVAADLSHIETQSMVNTRVLAKAGGSYPAFFFNPPSFFSLLPPFCMLIK